MASTFSLSFAIILYNSFITSHYELKMQSNKVWTTRCKESDWDLQTINERIILKKATASKYFSSFNLKKPFEL